MKQLMSSDVAELQYHGLPCVLYKAGQTGYPETVKKIAKQEGSKCKWPQCSFMLLYIVLCMCIKVMTTIL